VGDRVRHRRRRVTALRHRGVSSLQVTVNLLEQRAVDALLPDARSHGWASSRARCWRTALLARTARRSSSRPYCRSEEEEHRGAAARVGGAARAGRTTASAAQARLAVRSAVDGVTVASLGVRTVGAAPRTTCVGCAGQSAERRAARARRLDDRAHGGGARGEIEPIGAAAAPFEGASIAPFTSRQNLSSAWCFSMYARRRAPSRARVRVAPQ